MVRLWLGDLKVISLNFSSLYFLQLSSAELSLYFTDSLSESEGAGAVTVGASDQSKKLLAVSD